MNNALSIVDMSAWGWVDRAPLALLGVTPALAAFPELRRLYSGVDARPAVARARAIVSTHAFKAKTDDEAKRALVLSNYPKAPA